MAKIKFAGLGGLDEKGKNMYFFEVNSEIFVLDAGYSIPDNNNLGVEFIIPNVEYLRQNKDRIKGIFISHGHDDNFGALLYINNEFGNIPIYTSKATKIIIETTFARWNKEIPKNIISIEHNIVQKIGSVEVEAILMSHSVPGTYAFKFKTEDGNLLYMTDYIFEKINQYKGFNPKEFSKLTNEKNLLLLSDSSIIKLGIKDSSINIMDYIISKSAEHIKGGKMIFSVYEQDINDIITIQKIAKSMNKKVLIYGFTAATNLLKMMNQNVIERFELVPHTKITNKEIYDDTWIIFTGSVDKLFSKMLKVSQEEDELKLVKSDVWVNLAPSFAGNEKISTETINELSKLTRYIHTITSKEVRSMHPLQKDLELVLSFVNPKLFSSVKGFYKEMLSSQKVAVRLGMDIKNTIIPGNGEIHLIENGQYKGIERVIKEIGSAIVENTSNTTIAAEIINERKTLSEEGIAVIGIMWDKEKKDLVSQIDVQMRGVMFLKKHTNIVDLVKEKTEEIIREKKDNFNIPQISKLIDKEITKILRKYANKTPIIIPHILIV